LVPERYHFLKKIHPNGAENLCFFPKKIGLSSVKQIIDSNLGFYKKFCDILKSDSDDEKLKKTIKKRKLGEDPPYLILKMDEESMKYFLWFDSERSSLFFAKKVFICEGATEKIFLNFMFDEHWGEFRKKHVYLLDAGGKFNLHRFMGLLGALGIEHSVLLDSDGDAGIHEIVNSFLTSQENDFTKVIHFFEKDLEEFLGIEKPSRGYSKPLNVMMKYGKGEITEENLEKLKDLLLEL